ncbi:50S ribosomal protein L13 [Candidatus Gottesmanbacteria bacterium]|nr:50S ribosomal protein L13 [Candidatus Gottesmanbacteria bacterium]
MIKSSSSLTKPTKINDIKRDWHLIDVDNEVLGRISTKIASLLIGKNKPYFTPNLDCGDHVIVINTAKIRVTGRKTKQKIYDSYSGYPGGRKALTFEYVLKTNPKRIIEESVSGMLPKNKLRDSMMKRLYVFVNTNHPYQSKLKATN